MKTATSSRITFPESGMKSEEILSSLKEMKERDIDWRGGCTWSLVYFVNDAHLDLLKQAHNLFFSENTINPFAFPSVQRMEHDLVRMTADLLHGDDQTVGTLTTGGSESIALAIFSYRERARQLFPQIKAPEMIVPASIHPAFLKAANLMDIKVCRVPLRRDFRADTAAMEAAITPNTILIAASAPCFPYGVLDPINRIGEVAYRHGLPFHVDACVGGFMLPWVEELGYEVDPWDFRAQGVTSVSADFHKFGYSAKGISTLIYRSMEYLRYQFYILPDWCGGIYASGTLIGTRAVGPIASAWAAVRSLGREGYRRIARQTMDAAHRLRHELETIPEVEILGAPVMNMLAYTTRANRPDIFVIAGLLSEKGWLVDLQQQPDSIHLGVMSHNIPVLDKYLDDLREAVAYGLQHPEATAKGKAALYGMMAHLPSKGVVKENVRKIFEEIYGSSSTMPE